MEIQNASTTPSKSNQLRNVNTVRWESGNVTAQPSLTYAITFVLLEVGLSYVTCTFLVMSPFYS